MESKMETFPIVRADFLMLERWAKKEFKMPDDYLPILLQHKECGRFLTFHDHIDRPMASYRCDCGLEWYRHAVDTMTDERIGQQFQIAYVDDKEEVAKLVVVESKGVAYTTLQTMSDEERRDSRFQHMQAIRAKAK